MGDDRALDEAGKLWDDYISRPPDPLDYRETTRNQVLGNLHILGARIFGAREEAKASTLLVERQRSENFLPVMPVCGLPTSTRSTPVNPVVGPPCPAPWIRMLP